MCVTYLRWTVVRNSIAVLSLGPLAVLGLAGKSKAAEPYRLYDFEAGTPNSTTTTVQDVITDKKVQGTSSGGAPPLTERYWIEVPGATPRPLPAGAIQSVVDEYALAAPSLDASVGQGTYVDVSDGSGKDSPAPGSNVALQFDGLTTFNDLASGGGSRQAYVTIAGFDANSEIEGGVTAFESFSMLSQAWVYPDSAAQGFDQTVYQIGQEQGAAKITADGFWKLGALGPFYGEDLVTAVPVQFDAWTHIGIYRGGNGAAMYINGELAAGDPITPDKYFNTFADLVVLGSDDFGIEGFTGLVDNFSMSGFYDGLFDPEHDFEWFATVSQPLLGDYNGNGSVDAADYTIWKDSFGQTVDPNSGADGNGNGMIDAADYTVWKDNFGNSAVAVATNAVPEPASLVGLLTALGLLLATRRK